MLLPSIDAHIHHYPETWFKQITNYSYHEPHWAYLMHSPIQGWATTQKLIDDMDIASVTHTVLLGWYWQTLSMCLEHNTFLSQCMYQHKSRFTAFASTQPLAGTQALDAIKKAVDQGHKGIGEMFPKAQGFSMQHPVWLKIVEWAIDNKLPVLIHVTDPNTHDYPGKCIAEFEDYIWLARTYPELKLILAHWGGLIALDERYSSFCKQAPNLYFDTSASPLLYPSSIFQQFIETIGPNKILYGSDYPLRLYPKKDKKPNFNSFLEAIHNLDLPQKTLENILYNNTYKLLNE